jgi:multidrug efflux pump subunit AcrA (membrane-fusion protein)
MSTATRRSRFDTPPETTPPTEEMPEEMPGETPGVLPAREPAPSPLRQLVKSRKFVLGALLTAGVLLVIVAGAALMGSLGGSDQPLVFYTVVRGDLAIVVTERGNLQSQHNLKVICKVDDIEGDNIHGTPILWVVPNGSNVVEGELLVELDAANHRNRLDSQILNANRARSEQIQAKVKYDNQITLNKTTEADAALGVQLAELDQEMFVDETHGTHRLEVEEIKRLIEDANNQILQAQATLELKRNEKRGVESLFKLGYAGKSEFDRVRLDFLQAENEYAARMNKLRTQMATLKKKETYGSFGKKCPTC